MVAGPHPLLNPYTAPSVDMDGNSVSYSTGAVTIDGTPYCLAGLVIGAGALLWLLKASGFKFVIGIGG